MTEREIEEYLGAVTDLLSGHPAAVPFAFPPTPEALRQEEDLREVWGLLGGFSVPDPEEGVLERCYREALAMFGSGGIDMEELDGVVGAAAREPLPEGD